MPANASVKGFLLTVVLSLLGLVAPVGAQEATFTDLHDLVPDRCFSAALSTVSADAVDIGIESGIDSATWINKACTASTTPFNSRTVTDTFTVTVTAPPGMRIARVHYEQAGTRFVWWSPLYWHASGIGTLTVNGVPLSFSFTAPSLIQTVDLAGQDVQSTTVSVSINLLAERDAAFPRIPGKPGYATIQVTNAVIRVEYQ
jgi:hypothetical protein